MPFGLTGPRVILSIRGHVFRSKGSRVTFTLDRENRRGKMDLDPVSRIEQLCAAKGIVLTEQRRVIARVLSGADDHPNVEQLHRRANAVDKRIAIATVYRTLRLFEETGVIERHDFGAGRARYEETPEEHHDHLVDLRSGKVIEFQNDAIEELQRQVAAELGYDLTDHRLELYGVPLEEDGPGAA